MADGPMIVPDLSEPDGREAIAFLGATLRPMALQMLMASPVTQANPWR
jgi:hypothetical protein